MKLTKEEKGLTKSLDKGEWRTVTGWVDFLLTHQFRVVFMTAIIALMFLPISVDK